MGVSCDHVYIHRRESIGVISLIKATDSRMADKKVTLNRVFLRWRGGNSAYFAPCETHSYHSPGLILRRQISVAELFKIGIGAPGGGLEPVLEIREVLFGLLIEGGEFHQP